MAPLSKADEQHLKHALTSARAGGASLNTLMQAHLTAERHRLPHVASELRQHIRALIPNQRAHISISNNILLGIVTGFITHYMLQAVSHSRKA